MPMTNEGENSNSLFRQSAKLMRQLDTDRDFERIENDFT